MKTSQIISISGLRANLLLKLTELSLFESRKKVTFRENSNVGIVNIVNDLLLNKNKILPPATIFKVNITIVLGTFAENWCTDYDK